MFNGKILVLLALILGAAVVVPVSAAEEAQMRGSSSVSYSASITRRWNGIEDKGSVFTFKNQLSDTGERSFSGMTEVRNGYGTDMPRAKFAIEAAVGYDVDLVQQKQWSYRARVEPNKTISIGLRHKYLCQDLSTTRYYSVWLGNGLEPTITPTPGTAWAKQWYAFEGYHTAT